MKKEEASSEPEARSEPKAAFETGALLQAPCAPYARRAAVMPRRIGFGAPPAGAGRGRAEAWGGG